MTKKTEKPTASANEHEIEIQNSGPLERFSFRTRPGWNYVLGENDSGKSQGVMPAVLIVSGDENANFVLRRGAAEGSIKLDGKPVMIPKRVNKNGDVELQVLNHSPIAGVINPGYDDEKVNERRRLESFLKLMPIPVTAENLAMLLETQNPEGLEDLEAAIANVEDELITENLEELSKPDKNIVDVKEWLRRELNAWALRYDKQADEAQGEINAHTRERPENLTELTVEQADAAYRDAVGDLRQAEGEWDQRQKREAEREKIQGTLGERPDIAAAEELVKRAEGTYQDISETIMELEKKLAHARSDATSAKVALDGARTGLQIIKGKATKWDEGQAILNTEIVGATAKDVERLAAEAETAKQQRLEAFASDEYRKSVLAQQRAVDARDGALKYSVIYRNLAQGLTTALSAVLASAGVPGVSVNEKGFLCATKRNGDVETFQSLNYARRAEVAIDAWAAGRDLDGAIIAIPLDVYTEFDPATEKAIGEKWIEHNIHAVVAVPADGKLRVEHQEDSK